MKMVQSSNMKGKRFKLFCMFHELGVILLESDIDSIDNACSNICQLRSLLKHEFNLKPTNDVIRKTIDIVNYNN